MMRSKLSLLVLLGFGCEAIVDFDRSRIPTDDAAADAAPEDAAHAHDSATDSTVPTDAMADGGMDASDAAAMACTPDAGGCDDGNRCTDDACGTDNLCSHMATTCADDGDPCTIGVCDQAVGCMQMPICGITASTATAVLREVVAVRTMTHAVGHLVVRGGATLLGSTHLDAAGDRVVRVELNRAIVAGEVLHFELFGDDGDGMFEETDMPIRLMGTAVTADWTAAVADGTPDVEFVVTAVGAGDAYAFGEGAPMSRAPFPTGQNVTVTLQRGLRYRWVNRAGPAHPLRFQAGTVEAPGTFALTQGAFAAPLESNAGVNWVVEPGEPGAVVFTVTPDFEAAVTMYQCETHTVMRGMIAYAGGS